MIRPSNLYYRLEGHTPVECANVIEWGCWLESSDRLVEHTHVGRVFVSTVFIGIDQGFGMTSYPLLFETMVFGGWHDGLQVRTPIWDTAVSVHADAVAMVRRTRWWPLWLKKVQRWWQAPLFRRPARDVTQININTKVP